MPYKKGVIDSEGSPPDLDPEYDSYRDWQERLADRPPAEWWDDHLSGMETAQAKQAEAALQRITRRGCPPVVVLEPLREVWDYTEHPPVPRYVVLAHAEHIQRLIEAAANVADDLLFYGADGRLIRAVHTVNQSAPSRLADLKANADLQRRAGDAPLNSAIFAVLQSSRSCHWQPPLP